MARSQSACDCVTWAHVSAKLAAAYGYRLCRTSSSSFFILVVFVRIAESNPFFTLRNRIIHIHIHFIIMIIS